MAARASPTPPAMATATATSTPSAAAAAAASRPRPSAMVAAPPPPKTTTATTTAAAAAAAAAAAVAPDDAAAQLAALQADMDSLRAHVSCKICDRLLYQPFTIACGHTYCYTCLCTWFVANRAHKTCPDCRVVVREPPAPAYLLRELTAVFVSRQSLLPPGETLDQHRQWQAEEAAAVQHDRNNQAPRTGGLFKGCFAPSPRRAQLHVVRDNEDGVDRCPMCTWELEDGGCAQCGLVFDAAGDVEWDNGFTGFSDFDDMSEHDVDDLDALDADMGLDYPYLDDHGLMMRRFLDAGMAMRRPMSHSEAGSRRSYSQSIADVYGDEMDTVEEEDEEDDEDDDSSMHDFIVDDDPDEDDDSTSGASSTPAQTPQPPRAHARPRPSARARPVVEESETSSSVAEDDDDDDDDAGPVRRGPLHRAHTRALHRANGSSSSLAPPSSVSTDVSTEELDEDTQALLQEQGWQLQHDEDEDDDMGDDDDEDSDGARTTVGWEPLANTIDRVRMGGSLTPTADRPRPSAPIRPPSRGALDASRGLRRRSSVLSPAVAAPYEDGEADDDDSDQDADVSRLAMHHLRARRSQMHVRPAAPLPQEADTDDNSDQSQAAAGRRPVRAQRREYDPRISWMFASHQANLQEHQQMTGALIDVESRAMTPLGRPRTANRSRQSPAPAYSPFLPPARLRTPLADTSTPSFLPASRMLASPPRRSAMSPALPETARSSSGNSASSASAILTPGSTTPSSQNSIDSTVRTHAAAAIDMIDRPQSRVGARPPSAAGRRSSANFSPVPFAHSNIGLHGQGAALAPYQARGATNPWAAFVQRGLRNRNSQLRLREQSSTATLRAPTSRVNIRESAAAAPSQGMRTQASRNNLRSQPSRRQLGAQASTRTLRASEHTRPPPGSDPQAPSSPPATRTMRLPQDERDSRARELRNTRERALGLANHTPARTNPFAPGFRRLSNAAEMPTMTQASVSMPPHHVRSNSNESMHSVNSTGTAHGAPNSPRLARRNSNRNMVGAPPPIQGSYTAPHVAAYPTTTYRTRQGSVPSGAPVYESPLHNNLRSLNTNAMVTGPLI